MSDLTKLAEALTNLTPKQFQLLMSRASIQVTQLTEKKKKDWRLSQPRAFTAWLEQEFPVEYTKWDGWVVWFIDPHGDEWPRMTIELLNINGVKQVLVVDVRKSNIQ